ncbi:MAG: GNAT family N-acetyltransferase [Erythrobacter sp.]
MNASVCSVRLLGPDDLGLVLSTGYLFDSEPRPDQTAAMLSSERDFLWFAFDGERPVGFASATMVLHPDQLPVVFLNEIAVDTSAHRRGIGRMLLNAAIELSQSRGWGATWVLAERDDERATAFYHSLSPHLSQQTIMFEWENS